jgi:hypothetical protein
MGGQMAAGSALDQLLSWSNEEITEFDLALDRGRQVTETLAARSGGRPKGRRER